ncbi:hypothetical protein OC846_004165 [Tilletia horrida]|uniref:Uncharacterized protein n=1 Tax=Tilletia horrida TaxID=155126 RepID=A0AAN6GNT3_9BASI|nr:hypothetical protein OC846_004165 [Tilletia horrida]
MALLAPYNNAMRLGQGFNSYTHEICIDDAVVISPQQPENVLTNDGNSMRLTALVLGNPSVWTKQDQVLLDVSQFEQAEANTEEIAKEQVPVPASTDAQVEETMPAPNSANAASTEPTASAQPESASAPEQGEHTAAEPGEDPKVDNAATGAGAEKSAAIGANASGAAEEKALASSEKTTATAAADAEAAKLAEARKAEELKLKQQEVAAAQHRRVRDPAMLAAANKFKVNLSLDQMAEMHREFLLPKTKQAPGIGSQTQVFDIKNSTGVSQTVVFQSRFIDRISDVTSDMGVSASLSIKAGSCGGSARGSFIDSDKFNSSDLNYYLSVKVINQSINFKDALEFNPLDNVDPSDFRSIFGDSFISGFLEGGELNALISMKILNKAKASDIKAEGAIALGKGSLDIQGTGAFSKAKANLEMNTETTVQVSWLGGGIIKPPEEAWTVDSLARAATRFPDHVAQSPQRTYAILTKYENLRSYQVLKPPSVTPLDYKNASAYTNELLDVFMSYKQIYSRLTAQISDIQSGQLKFKIMEEADQKTRADALAAALSGVNEFTQWGALKDKQKQARIGFFSSTLDGLDDARSAVRTQMNFIIERVDDITKDPSKVLDDPSEKFLPSFAFEELLPVVESAFRNNKRTAPLTGEQMYKKDDDTDNSEDQSTASRMCLVKKLPAASTDSSKGKDIASTPAIDSGDHTPVELLDSEATYISMFLSARDDGIEDTLRLTPALGNEDATPRPPGNLFNALDFVQPNFLLQSVKVTVQDGVVCGLACRYANGMSWKRGITDKKTGLALDLGENERITSVIVTVGTESVLNTPDYVLSLKLVTNSGRNLEAFEPNVRRGGYNRRFIGKRAFYDVRSITFESPLEHGYMIGFWGWSAEQGINPGLARLGVVWANSNAADAKLAPTAQEVKAAQDEASKETRFSSLDAANAALSDANKDLKDTQSKVTTLTDSLTQAQLAIKQKQDEFERYQRLVKNQQWILGLNLKTFSIEHSSGKMLDHYINVHKPNLWQKNNGGWNQTYRLELCGNGFRIAQADGTKDWYLVVPPLPSGSAPSSKAPASFTNNKLDQGTVFTLVPVDSDWFNITSIDDTTRPLQPDTADGGFFGLGSVTDANAAKFRFKDDPIAAAQLKQEQDNAAAAAKKSQELQTLTDILNGRRSFFLHTSKGTVADFNWMNQRLSTHGKHGGWNQQFTLEHDDNVYGYRIFTTRDGNPNTKVYICLLVTDSGSHRYEAWLTPNSDRAGRFSVDASPLGQNTTFKFSTSGPSQNGYSTGPLITLCPETDPSNQDTVYVSGYTNPPDNSWALWNFEVI